MDNHDNAGKTMAELFDFSAASMPQMPDFATEPVYSTADGACPAHTVDDCLCHGFVGDFDIPDAPLDATVNDQFQDFSSWIPRYSKPEQACDYCRSRQLECFMTFEGQTTCSPCNALFRTCSFEKPESHLPRGAIDTLHVVDEDACTHKGMLTKYKHLRSLGGPEVDTNSSTQETSGDKKSGIRFSRQAVKILKNWIDEHSDHPYPTEEEKEELKMRTGLRSIQVSNWLANARRRGKVRPKRAPSPSLRPASTTAAIDIRNGLPAAVVTDQEWRSMDPFERWKHSPPEHEPADASAIKTAMARSHYDSSHSSESPNTPRSRHHTSNESSNFSQLRSPSTTSAETSLLSSGSHPSLGSARSHSSRNSFGSFHSLGSGGKKNRRRRRMVTKQSKTEVEVPRLFQCTFCTDKFKNKYDWARHEKSLHLNLEKWICAPLGKTIVDCRSGQIKCVYCDTLNPTEEHLEEHNHEGCESKGLDARTFYRKDHLRQHLRLMHSCKMTPSMETWKSESVNINCRCGFCGERFSRWPDRVDHLAKHFRNGAKMTEWKGCRGLDSAVAVQVTNAMPVFLIGEEGRSPFPFSASNEASMRNDTFSILEAVTQPGIIGSTISPTTTAPDDAMQEDAQYALAGFSALNIGNLNDTGLAHAAANLFGPHCINDEFPSTTSSANFLPAPATSAYYHPLDTFHEDLSVNSIASNHSNHKLSTCWEILTVQLGQFTRERIRAGAPPSDEQLQAQARMILYECDDPWNQTAADNSEWLDLFKRAHGLDTTNVSLGAQGTSGGSSARVAATPEDKADLLEDLGVGAGIDLTSLGFETSLGPSGSGSPEDLGWSTMAAGVPVTSAPVFNTSNNWYSGI